MSQYVAPILRSLGEMPSIPLETTTSSQLAFCTRS
jgi:hypothetical protein